MDIRATPTNGSKHILLVDDDEGILEALTAMLEFEGYSIKKVSSATEALRAVEKERPQLILLDLLLGGVNGTAVAYSLKSNPNTSAIPIIMLSAHPTAAAEAQKCGADDFIAKPFDIDELLEKINRYTA